VIWEIESLAGCLDRIDESKSIAGSAALVVRSNVTSAALLWWMQCTGCLVTELPVWPKVL